MPRICTYFARNRKNPLVAFAVGKAKRILACYENADNYDFTTNGESFVIRALAARPLARVFDVGANVGEWALLAHDHLRAARIDCFEVLPATADALQQATGMHERIAVHRFGLSNETGQVQLKTFKDLDVLTSLVPVEHDFAEAGTAAGQVMRGDEYCAQQGIDHIDLLKIDVEAAEFMVLQGFSAMLERQQIDVIQFEYGTGSIVTRFLLKDYYALLGSYGYLIGKIYPNYVEFREYHEDHEDFIGPNMLAVRADRDELVALLSGA